MEGCTCHRGRLLCTSGMWSTSNTRKSLNFANALRSYADTADTAERSQIPTRPC